MDEEITVRKFVVYRQLKTIFGKSRKW